MEDEGFWRSVRQSPPARPGVRVLVRQKPAKALAGVRSARSRTSPPASEMPSVEVVTDGRTQREQSHRDEKKDQAAALGIRLHRVRLLLELAEDFFCAIGTVGGGVRCWSNHLRRIVRVDRQRRDPLGCGDFTIKPGELLLDQSALSQ